MIYLTGSTRDNAEPALIAAGIGLMLQPGNGYHHRAHRYPYHAIDCGLSYTDVDAYLDWLAQRNPHKCLFAVSPDAYPDPNESLRRGLQYAPLVRSLGFPAAVVAQDGAEHLHWPWDDLDALFIGGRKDTQWKTGPAAETLANRARAAGKWVHMGRVNSLYRITRAREMGCNSADGTYLKYRHRTLGRGDPTQRGATELAHWHAWLTANQTLFTHETPALPIHRDAVRHT